MRLTDSPWIVPAGAAAILGFAAAFITRQLARVGEPVMIGQLVFAALLIGLILVLQNVLAISRLHSRERESRRRRHLIEIEAYINRLESAEVKSMLSELSGRLRAEEPSSSVSNTLTKEQPLRKGLLDELKDFSPRRHVVDIAVGVALGLAFGEVASSFTNDLLLPLIGFLIDGVDFSSLSLTFREGAGDVGAVTVRYGVFLGAIVNFLIIAVAVFLVLHAVKGLKEPEKPAASPETSKEQDLLAQIRDALSGRLPPSNSPRNH